MDRFPRGSLVSFKAISIVAPTAVAKPDSSQAEPAPDGAQAECNLSTTCPSCGAEMRPEHAHYKCPACGYRDSCCF